MEKMLSHKKLVLAFVIVICILTILLLALNRNIFHYFSTGNYSEPNKTCEQKKMIWDKKIYVIDKNPSGGKLVLKVENRNESFWYELLDSVESSDEQFKKCVKGIVKLPVEIENSQTTPSEIKERSQGLELSIGTQEYFKYTPIAELIFNVRLFSNRFTDESYNLDAAIANIAENTHLTQESNGIWRLSFKRMSPDYNLPFYYDLIRINDKEVLSTNQIEFISKDNGKSWAPIVKSP